MLVLYIILLVSTLAVVAVGLAFHFRVKRHMKGAKETRHKTPVQSVEAPLADATEQQGK